MTRQDLATVYEELRRQRGPVVPVEIAPGVAAWLVLSHQEVLEVIWNARLFSSDPRRWSAALHGMLPEGAPMLALLGPRLSLFQLDGKEHLRHRRAMTTALDQIDPRRLIRMVRHEADALVDTWAARESADLMAHFARPLVWRAFTYLIGVSESSISALDSLVETIVYDDLPGTARAEGELLSAMRRLVAERSVAPGPDLPSWLTQAARLTDEEIAHNLVALLLHGPASIINWIGNTMRSLFGHLGPIRAAATGNLVADMVEHALRAGAPVPNITGRWATADVTLAGCRIRAGDLVIPCVAAANTDPCLQDAPLSHTRAHLAWGTGAHGCPAKDTARLITETAIEVLLDRLPGVRPALPDAVLRRRPSLWCGAPAELPVVFSAATRSYTNQVSAPPSQLTVMDAPARVRRDAVGPESAPQRWSWWNSLGGW
ncbi:cytochrome P450 [Streptomyces flavidovirens]|uniref:cytochrome P450 n=1 Tax=Streptomyces flavidovirens TaxID=67298 RepID=UPI0012FE8D77|nr:cytochrome P450 [Streptomyces flavidovirens]